MFLWVLSTQILGQGLKLEHARLLPHSLPGTVSGAVPPFDAAYS